MSNKKNSQENRDRRQAREVTSRFAAIAFFALVAMLCLYVILVSPWDSIVSWILFKSSCTLGVYAALTEIWALRYSEQEHAEIHRERLAEERHQLKKQELLNERNKEEAKKIEQIEINNVKNQRNDVDSQLNIARDFDEVVEEIKGKAIVTVKGLAEYFAHEQDAVYAHESLLRLELISANGSPNFARISFWTAPDRALFRNVLEAGLFAEPANACIQDRIRAEKQAAPARSRISQQRAKQELSLATRQKKADARSLAMTGHTAFTIYGSYIPQGPTYVGPDGGDEAWDSERAMWNIYLHGDVPAIQKLLDTVKASCNKCGRTTSVRNKVSALQKLGKMSGLPTDLYWRQMIVNTQWAELKWQIEPSDIVKHCGTPALSSAARRIYSNAWSEFVKSVNTPNRTQLAFERALLARSEVLSQVDSPFPHWGWATGQHPYSLFSSDETKHSDDAWKEASRWASVASSIDDCLDCVTRVANRTGQRRSLSPRLRMQVLQRDGLRCTFCGRSAPEVKLHVDHIEPVSKGGSNEMDNLQALCEECNLAKSDQELV